MKMCNTNKTEAHCFSLLKKAYELFDQGDRIAYEKKQKEVAAVLKNQKNSSLYGEWLLLSTLPIETDINTVCDRFKDAADLLAGKSQIIPSNVTPFLNYYNVFGICNRMPGQAKQVEEKLKEYLKLFEGLIGGGSGMLFCYKAQYAYYQGNLKNAVDFAQKAIEEAEQEKQNLTALAAAEIIAQVSKHEMDTELWSFSYGYIEEIAEGRKPVEKVCRQQAVVIRCMLDMSLGVFKNIPQWIQSGEYGAVSTPWGYRMMDSTIESGALANVCLTKVELECYRGESVKALLAADIAQKIYGIHSVIYDAYMDFLRACCYLQLEDADAVRESISRGIEKIAPDALWLIAAEFEEFLGDILYEVLTELAPEGIDQIHKISANYWKKLAFMRSQTNPYLKNALTKRELEVAGLLTEKGMSNTEIAIHLHISESTVKRHLEHIFKKLKISRRTKLLEALKHSSEPVLAAWVK